ncbi:MAG: hotdog fold domain-containing protein [Halioglobus sp.]
MNNPPDTLKALFNPFASEEITPPYSEQWEAKRRVAQAIRELTDVLITSTPPTQALHDMAEKLEQQTQEFSRSKRLYGLLEFIRDGEHGDHGEINHELNGVGGWSNPLSPGLNIWIEGNKAYGRVNCGYAYEGPPGHIHGGHVAAIFDQFLGMAQLAGKKPGMTGTLTMRYLKPTPLNTDLDLEAEVEILEGRKTRVKGKIINKGCVTATCEGLFIRPKWALTAND